MRQKISVYIPVLNEESRIRAALESVAWADEIVIVDTGCTDSTIDMARKYTDHILEHKFTGFGALRNAGIDACSHPWILSLDADERCSPELKQEIETLLSGEPEHEAYWIPRLNWFMGRWIRHSGWYPDYCQPKLFRKQAMRYRDEDEVHEGWKVDGSIGFLHNDIIHFSFQDLSDILRKIDRYSELGAEKLARQKHHPPSIGLAFLRGCWAFIRIYLLKKGFLDGAAGFVIALSNFQGTFYRHAKAVWKLRAWNRPPPGDGKE